MMVSLDSKKGPEFRDLRFSKQDSLWEAKSKHDSGWPRWEQICRHGGVRLKDHSGSS